MGIKRLISQAPLPLWTAPLAFLCFWKKGDLKLEKSWIEEGGVTAGWLSRSVWSLALLASWRSRIACAEPINFWVPDYFCNEALVLIRRMNVRLHFYPVTKQLQPNYALMFQQKNLVKPDILLVVHYFGIPNSIIKAKEICKSTGAWLVEDSTHMLLPARGVGSAGDFVLYSPYKLLAIPHGALLLTRTKGPSRLTQEFINELGPPEAWATNLEKLFPDQSAGYRNALWIAKRYLQKLGINGRPSVTFTQNLQTTPPLPPPQMSKFAKYFLRAELKRLPEIALLRKRNKLLLDYIVEGLSPIDGISPSLNPDQPYFTPYLARYEALNANDWFTYLHNVEMPVSTWPDLPKEVREESEKHSDAHFIRNSSFFLPLHQSLKGREFLPLLSTTCHSGNKVKVQEFQGSATMWHKLMCETKVSNILQSWGYGECKRETNGWGIERLVIIEDARVKGYAQVLKRKIGPFTLSRLNRGPLFLEDTDMTTRLAGLTAVRDKLGNWRQGKFLSWAPECTLEGKYLFHLEGLRINLRRKRGWSSLVLDIQHNESTLRANLRSTWRKTLEASERLDVVIRQSDDEQTYKKFIKSCAAEMKKRGVVFSEKFLTLFYKHQSERGLQGLLLTISSGETPISGIYVVVHGNTATYLLGWKDIKAREIGSHHLLVWDAILRLKKINVKYFDLGGIDEELAPGISTFKRGLGAQPFELIGDTWCL